MRRHAAPRTAMGAEEPRRARRLSVLVTLVALVAWTVLLVPNVARAGTAPVSPFSMFPVPQPNNCCGGPGAITAGPDGNIWFAGDLGGQWVVGRMTPQGAFAQYPLDGEPKGITVGQDGNLWVVTQRPDDVVQITTGGTVDAFTMPPTNPQDNCVGLGANSHFAEDITAGPDGDLWYTEECPSAVVQFDPRNGHTNTYVLPLHPDVHAQENGDSDPLGIVSGPDGNLWFTESAGNRVGQITTAGVVSEFVLPIPIWGADQNKLFNNPNGISVGPDGNLWFTTTCRIGRITTSGTLTMFYEGPNQDCEATDNVVPSLPQQIVGGADGNLWFTEATNGSTTHAAYVGRITPAGALSLFQIPGGNSDSLPSSIARGPSADPSGVWFSIANYPAIAEGALGRIDTTQADAHAISMSGTTVSLVEGKKFSGTLASFTDADHTTKAGQYAATVEWGDGTTSAASVTGTNPFTVNGSHVYAEEGYYDTIRVSVTDRDGYVATLGDASSTLYPGFGQTLYAADAPLSATGKSLTLQGTSVSGAVASFSDADGGGTLSDYTATIDWGDGSSSSGTLGSSAKRFVVNGSHTYATQGTYTVTVTVSDQGGSTAVATTTT